MVKRSRARLSQSNRVTAAVAFGTSKAPSSALQSNSDSEVESYFQPAKFDASTIPIHALTLKKAEQVKQTTITNDFTGINGTDRTTSLYSIGADIPSSAAVVLPPEIQPFRFLDLPSELRLNVYRYHFEGTGAVLDLSPDNVKTVFRKLQLLRACRRIYLEASHLFYSTHPVRVFPTYGGRFFKTRRPLLARLAPRQRMALTRLELRLGPGFNKPPKCWAVNAALGLRDCINVRRLFVFVQIDPSFSWLDGYRKAGFYEDFSCNLLDSILSNTPAIEVVEFDAVASIRKSCPIMVALLQATAKHNRKVAWGPERGWTDADDNDAADPGHRKGPTVVADSTINSTGTVSSSLSTYETPISAAA